VIAAGRSRKPKIYPGGIQLSYCCWRLGALVSTQEGPSQVIAAANLSLTFYPGGVQLEYCGWRFPNSTFIQEGLS
jgi:hypothetical protein